MTTAAPPAVREVQRGVRAPWFGPPAARAGRVASDVLPLAIRRAIARRAEEQQGAEYRAFRERYFHDPAGFARDCIVWKPGEGLTPYQIEVIGSLADHDRVSVRGPHGLGKSTMGALVILWFALTRDGLDWKAVTTASVWRQLTKFLWPEVHKWVRRVDWQRVGREPFREGHELLDLALKLSTGEAFAAASDKPTAIEGAHADHLLYLFDEAKAIVSPTWDAAEGAFSAAGSDTPQHAHAFATSTPGDTAGRFYDIHQHAPGYEDWKTRHVTLDEAVDAGRISRQWAAQRKRQWGEDSALYQNRVLGEFAAGDDGGIIPLAWVEAAQARWRAARDAGQLDELPEVVGVDVSDGGDDKTYIVPRRGHAAMSLIDVTPKARGETMTIAGRVKGLADGVEERGGHLLAVVDSIGVGAGVVSRLGELEVAVEPFNASESTKLRDMSGSFGFLNKRAAAYWNLREILDPESGLDAMLPDDPMLTAELTVPQYRMSSGGRLQLQSKDDVRQKLGRSPDRADAVVMAFWGQPTGGTMGALPWAARKAEGSGEAEAGGRASAPRRRSSSMGALPWDRR
ncbi:hypothetical protein [uncultured Piscinibacter sp.]|uniref:hypothetical protein n=1 Tax=uncultured Piscinibacter sp. TaxID=1131835 RepID=UPI00261802A4|nr:hypothetical protein [uncultured Piscinibacter sp.]